VDTKIDGLGARVDTKIEGLGARLDTKIDELATRVDAKLDELATRVDTKIDGLKDTLVAAQSWAIVLYIALAAGTFGTMARAFGWI